MTLLAWLGFLFVCCGVALRGVYLGGRTRTDQLMAVVVSGCFAVYGLLGLGSLLALQGLAGSLVLAGLGAGAALMVPLFVMLPRRRDPGRGLAWWLLLAGQPAYAFAFWGGCTLGPWLVFALATGAEPLWPGHGLWPALGLSLWGSIWGMAWGQRVRRVRVDNPRAAGPGLRLVQLSDIHFGPGFPLRSLRGLCDRVAALEPDLVVISGDLVGPFSDSPGEHDGLVETLAALPAPVLFSAGNHDMPRWATLGPELRAGGITVLEDEAVTLDLAGERVWVLGVGFRWGRRRPSAAEVIGSVLPPSDASLRLVVTHGPRVLDLLRAETADIGFAGHTHGGPISLGMLGLPFSILRLTASHDHGLHRRHGVWHYVHSGNWIIGLPPRIGTTPEILVLEIGPPTSSQGSAMRAFIFPFVLLLATGCPKDPGDSAEHVGFTVLALPDTQEYADRYPEIFDAQTQWAVDEGVAMVTHLGDVVDNGPDDEQWANARASFEILEGGGIPYGVAMGNHDHMYGYGGTVDHSCSDSYTDIDCTSAHYLEYAGPSWTEGQAWFGGASPSGTSNWQSFEAGGFEWLFLNLAVDVPADELAWAQQVLDEHPSALVHVSTHRYLHDFRVVELMPELLHAVLPGRYNALVYQLGDPEYYIDSTTAEELWEDFIAANPNIYMVQCGHVDAEFRQVSENEAGLPVHELLTDFQSYHDSGGDGWLKQLDYDVTAGTITVSTYSPTLGRYRDNGEGLDASLELLGWALSRLGSYLESYGLDMDEIEALYTYWTTTEEGRQEYYEAAYGDGSRDSSFVLEVDFSAYAQAR